MHACYPQIYHPILTLTDFSLYQMGAPPNEDQIADMLSDPAVMATMNEYMNSPQFVDMMIQNNPMLANMPNAREMINSPMFRRMMTDPESLRMAARMRNMMGGGAGGASAFPAPGVTDNSPAAAPANNNAFGGNAAQGNPFMGMGGFGGAPGGDGGMADLARIFGAAQQPAAVPGSAPAPAQGIGADSNAQPGATGGSQQPNAAQANPFAALFGGGAGAQGAGVANNQNPFAMPGMPPITPEMMQQAAQMFGGGGQGQAAGMPSLEQMQRTMQMLSGGGGFGGGGFGGLGAPAAAAPPDNRPPEDIYAEQLRQLNDMGFFDFDRNVQALRRSGGSVQGAIEHLLNSP